MNVSGLHAARAMTVTQSNKRPALIFAILVVAEVLLISIQPRGKSEQSLLRVTVSSIAAPIQRAVSSATAKTSSWWRHYIDLRGARQEADALHAENDQLKQRALAAEEAQAENQRLRRLMDLRETVTYPVIVAELIGRSTGSWHSRITLGSGVLAGIAMNAPVITADGLVGRVIENGPNYSRVQLITDEFAGVGVQLANSRALGELKGRWDGLCDLKNISGLYKVDVGEAVLTSGLDGIYPKGLLVGHVASVVQGTAAVPHQIVVRPSAGLNGLEEVMVLETQGLRVRVLEEDLSKESPVEARPKQ